jgi:hypothetical protein
MNTHANASAGGAGLIEPDKRRARRKRTLKEGKVLLSDWTAIDCTIRDLTSEGARIVLGDATSLPQEFRLVMVATSTMKPVRLLWQRGLAAGVGFTGPEESGSLQKT